MFVERTSEEMAALDRFAAVTLKYLLAETQLGDFLANNSILLDSVKEKYAAMAYDMADAMLKAREEQETYYVEE